VYLLGIPAVLTAWYGWSKGQSLWIISVQMMLGVILTLVFTAFMFAATTDVSACFS
jgi:hypothetical protein